MTRSRKTGIVVAFLAAAVGLFVVLQRTGDKQEAGENGAATFDLAVPDGGPTSVERFAVTQGRHVVLTITLPEDGEVHLHGYDLTAETGPGQPPAVLEFDADDPGVFELEIEDTGTPIAELSVNP